LLQGARHDWVISTKVGEEFVNGESRFDFSPIAIRQSVERSLLRLQTDCVDIVLVHSNGEDEKLIQELDVFSELAAMKTAGKIRAYGMSTKTIAGGKLAVRYADIVMVAFNANYTDEREVIAYAYQHNKAVLIKKAFASGHLAAAGSLSFVLAEQGVTSVVVGTIDPVHLRDNAANFLI
jgi:aryl-alcohol dehydrogenase-like predicted oxidoreductase